MTFAGRRPSGHRAAVSARALEMASAMPLSQISVTDLCRAAGVTRDTFYRHAAGVTELVADALEAELREVTATLGAEAAVRSFRCTSARGTRPPRPVS